jgi:hypothetical protein
MTTETIGYRGAITLALLLAASCTPPDVAASEREAETSLPGVATPREPEGQHPLDWFPAAHAERPLEPATLPNGGRMARPLFSCDVTSFAWGEVAFGHVLDEEGQIWSYDLGDEWSPSPASESGLSLEAGLRVRFHRSVLQSRHIEQDELDRMQLGAELAQEGPIQEARVSFDAGSSGCTAYLWEQPQAYRSVELGTFGDVSYRNLSPEAAEVLVWLRQELGMGAHPPVKPTTHE